MIATAESLESIVSRHIGPPHRPRKGAWGPFWLCPFHEDRNPSFALTPNGQTYYCFGCKKHGDAIDFVRGLDENLEFREAVAVVGGELPTTPTRRPRRPILKAAPRASKPDGWDRFVEEILAEAKDILWSDEGSAARGYLHGRGLGDETIRSAGLGYWPRDTYHDGVFPDRKIRVSEGILIPWRTDAAGPVSHVNIRRPPDRDPKYMAIAGGGAGAGYPSRRIVRAKRPLVIVEGEFEALLLGQEIGDLVPVITFGSAGNKPDISLRLAIFAASPWILAGDTDAAGEAMAEVWRESSMRCIRVRPPSGHKDWTEAFQAGVDLRSFWEAELARLGCLASPAASPGPVEGPAPRITSTASLASTLPAHLEAEEHPATPWREVIASWLAPWRRRWGELANLLEDDGVPWREAESRAFDLAAFELKSGGTPEPIPAAAPKQLTARWECLNLFCPHEAGWWMSEWGVVHCLGCRPPADPKLVFASGPKSDAPMVEFDRCQQATREEMNRRLAAASEVRGGGL